MQKADIKNTNGNKFFQLKLANNIVISFLNNNEIDRNDLPATITQICECIGGLHGESSPSPKETPDELSAAPQETIFEDYIICLEDGRRYKTLKRTLMSRFGLTPDAYRRKWNLPADYPMVAPASARKMSALSKMEKDETETR